MIALTAGGLENDPRRAREQQREGAEKLERKEDFCRRHNTVLASRLSL